eukprot:2729756-Pyramimonas_sp.AAC.1
MPRHSRARPPKVEPDSRQFAAISHQRCPWAISPEQFSDPLRSRIDSAPGPDGFPDSVESCANLSISAIWSSCRRATCPRMAVL